MISTVSYINWGTSTDTPVTGDFDSDGKSDVAVYRGGVWYILNSATNSLTARQFGTTNDTALAGAFNQ